MLNDLTIRFTRGLTPKPWCYCNDLLSNFLTLVSYLSFRTSAGGYGALSWGIPEPKL